MTSIARSAKDRAIVHGVIDMARSLGLQAIAEGVENSAQRDILTELGCALGQGYFWTRPVPLEELPEWSTAPHLGSKTIR